jgi:hypothetical protein
MHPFLSEKYYYIIDLPPTPPAKKLLRADVVATRKRK